MKPNKRINIALDFSREPIGRYRSDGSVSGEVFREEVLCPALSEFDQVEVVLDGTEGYGSSFLEEAFGGLVRLKGFTSKQLREKLKLISTEEPILIDEILGYIDEAQPTISNKPKR